MAHQLEEIAHGTSLADAAAGLTAGEAPAVVLGKSVLPLLNNQLASRRITTVKSRRDFAAGLAALKVTTVAQVKRALPGLEEQVDMDPEAFQDFCTFAFKFCLTVRNLSCSEIGTLGFL